MKPECERITALLVDGVSASEDAALAEHLGTCLTCYRTQAELRDVPRLAAALEAAAPADPGEAFWSGFAARTWAAAHADADAPAPAARPVAAPTPPSLVERFTAWLARPLPAAMAGVAGLALIVLALRPGVHAPAPRPVHPAAVPAPSLKPGAAQPSAGPLVLPPADVDDLDETALRSVLDAMAADAEEAIKFERALSDEGGDLTAVQRLQGLDADALRVLAADLDKTPI